MGTIAVPGKRWHQEVPGARWFRCDLHIHTLDDHPSPNLKWPSGLHGLPTDQGVQLAYARRLLQAAVTRGIEVLGLTPHCPRSGETDETSTTWRVVEEWMAGLDDDGVPFREKIYAVFPGFEPSLSVGSRGVHLQFLFDPCIGRDAYLRAFQCVMGGVNPWQGSSLRMSPSNAKEVFESLVNLQREEKDRWRWMCIAPHAIDNNKGLFALKGQMLETFPHKYVSALELGDNCLPEDVLADRSWLKEGMEKYHHAFVHSSDAYSLSPSASGQGRDLGSRFTVLKLAKPTIEALRQSMLAKDSRLRLAYTKNADGDLVVRADLPDPVAANRPWLQSLSVSGGTSFFAGSDPDVASLRSQCFKFNPDLTVIIGGRMSGKSTLLDGLRVYFGRPMPADAPTKGDVESRAALRFQSGNPTIEPTVRGPVSISEPLSNRWPAQFFTQRELQLAVKDQKGLRKILYHLVPDSAAVLISSESILIEADSELAALAAQVRTKPGSSLKRSRRYPPRQTQSERWKGSNKLAHRG